VRKLSRHFIAINFHRFHDGNDAITCAKSVVISARCISGYVRIVFFHHSDQPIPAPLFNEIKALGLEIEGLPGGANGDCLNMQVSMARDYDFFYRVDADDVVSKGRFGWQVDIFQTTGCDICGGGLIYRNVLSGQEYLVIPPAKPAITAFLTNQFFLHPTLAFRLESFRNYNMRYGPERLEDKALAVSAVKAGLDIVNDPRIYGVYNINPHARNARFYSHKNLKYNLAFIRASRGYWAVPLAFGMYLVSLSISSERLRKIRYFVSRFRRLK